MVVANRSGHRQAPGRLVLFSFGGRAIKSKEISREAGRKRPEPGGAQRILDYATLLSWCREGGSGDAEIDEGFVAEVEFSKKQRDLKFLML